MIERNDIKKIKHLDQVQYMSCPSADSLKSEIRKLILYHDECGKHLENISIDHKILHLKFSKNSENEIG